MIAEAYQLGAVGIVFIIGGVFVLARRRSLARANAKDMIRWSWWTPRFNYSEEYFLILNTACGIGFILIGLLSLALFKDSEGRLPAPLEYVVVAVVGFLFIGGFISIIYVNFRFRKKKNRPTDSL
jgi:hypothetical protein